jgi:hypothetical protein
MKVIRLLLVSFFVLCASTTNVVASNESDKAKIQRAMKAAPRSISAEATIRDVDADWTIIRPGTNDWTCFPGVPVNPGDKHPMCNDEVWMDWLWAVKFLLEDLDHNPWLFQTDTVGYSYMLRGDALVDNDNPLNPGGPGTWDQEGPHIMMLFPTKEEIDDLPRDPNAGGPYVMWGDWPLIHVMVPITDRDR